MAVVLAIALAVVVTVLVVRPAGGEGGTGGDPTQPNGGSEFASADDTGPVSIITEDPTCIAWNSITRDLAAEENAVAWDSRDDSIPVESWTPAQRSIYDTVSAAINEAADKATTLAKQTPHRVMRELYQQFAAYGKSFTERLPTYKPEDDSLKAAADSFVLAAANMCSAIDYRSAEPVAPLISPADPPSNGASVDIDASGQVMQIDGSACSLWESLVTSLSQSTAAWRALDRNLAASDWTPEVRSANEAAAATFSANAAEMVKIGRESGSPIFEDVAASAAQYHRGFVEALPTYTKADNFLSEAATNLIRANNWACKAAKL